MFRDSCKRNKNLNRVILFFILLLIFCPAYIFGYKMMQIPSDISFHSGWANDYFNGTFQCTYPGYYLIFGFFSRILGLSDANAAAVSMGMFAVLAGIVVYVISGYYLGRTGVENERYIIVLFMSFFGPLNLGGPHYYIGQGSFNTWHNPTNSSVKFLTLICFFLFVHIYEMKSDDKTEIFGKEFSRLQMYLILVALTCCSLIFKPSFFQVFAPSLVVIYGLDFLMQKRSFGSCLKDAILFLPAIVIILYQALFSFGSEASVGGMHIRFAQGWSYSSDNIFRSIMTFALFPLLVCVGCREIASRNRMLYCAVIFYLMGIAEGLFLVESGPRAADGNFLWGNSLGIGVVYLASICIFIKFIKENKEKKSAKVIALAGSGLLFVQFLLGVWYIARCIMIPLQYF